MTAEREDDVRYFLGRIESKIDKLDEKLDHLAETVGRHDERLRNVEEEVKDLKTLRVSDIQQKSNDRGGLRAAVTGAICGALISGVFVVIQVLIHL